MSNRITQSYALHHLIIKELNDLKNKTTLAKPRLVEVAIALALREYNSDPVEFLRFAMEFSNKLAEAN